MVVEGPSEVMPRPVPTPTPMPTPIPTPTPEEERIREELQSLFLDLLTSAQKLSYEMATMEVKESYSRDELKDLFTAAREIVSNVKRMHRFLERYGRRR